MGEGGHAALDSVTDTIGSAATKARGPMIAGGAAAAGIVGGLVLGGRVLRPGTKLLGVRIARRDGSLRPVAKEIGRAGKQLGRMANEVNKAREQAQRIGKVLA
ncbi:MAG: hypothetical protein WBC33_06565 [Conexibacter sp.]